MSEDNFYYRFKLFPDETNDSIFLRKSGNVNPVPFRNPIFGLDFRGEGVKMTEFRHEDTENIIFRLYENPIGFRFALFVPEIFAFEKRYRNARIWHISVRNSGTGFFPDMRFSQNDAARWYLSFKHTLKRHSMIRFFAKVEKPQFLALFSNFLENRIFFRKSGSVSVLRIKSYIFMQKIRKI